LFRTKGTRALMKHIQNFLGFVEQRQLPKVLCFYFHPWEFIPCKKTYRYGEAAVTPQRFITKGCGAKAIKEFGLLIDTLKDMGAEFVTAADLADLF